MNNSEDVDHYVRPDLELDNESGKKTAPTIENGKKGRKLTFFVDGFSFRVTSENKKFWLFFYGSISLVFITSALISPDNFIVIYGERLPFLYGFPISVAHFMASNDVEGTRSVFVSFVSFFLLHLIFLVIFLVIFITIKLYNFVQNQKVSISIRSGAIGFRIFCSLLIFLGAVLDFSANLPVRNTSTDKIRTNWMAEVANKSIFNLFIPGSHDSAAIVGDFTGQPAIMKFIEPLSATNKHSITEQLELGIRYIDIRLCGAADGNALTCHGPILHYNSFLSVIEEINQFVEANPTEIIIIFVKTEFTQNVENTIEQEIYEPVVLSFDSFLNKLISPNEALTQTIGELSSSGRNIIFLTDNFDSEEIFKNVEKAWPSFFSPFTFREEFLTAPDKFAIHLEENICSGTTLDLPSTENRFILMNAQISGQAERQVPYMFFPMVSLIIFGGDRLESNDLEVRSFFANEVVLEHLSDEDCSAFRDFNIITHDFLVDELVQLVIDKNFD